MHFCKPSETQTFKWIIRSICAEKKAVENLSPSPNIFLNIEKNAMTSRHKRLKYAVIGLGNMGKNHVRTVRTLPDVDLVAVADPNANHHHGESVKWYPDYRDMIQREAIDALSICTPTNTHHAIATACIDRGVDILIEKPIAPSVEQAESIIKLAQNSEQIVMIGHIERYNPAVIRLKNIIESGDLGDIVSIVARRVGTFPPQIRDANIAIDLAIHDIDIVNFLTGGTPENIKVTKRRNHIERREDSADFFLTYKTCCAYIQANWITPVKIRKLHVTGTEGYTELDYISQSLTIYKSNYEKYRSLEADDMGYSDYILNYLDPDLTEIKIAKQEPLKNELKHFISAVRSRTKLQLDFALKALRIALSD